VVLTHAQNARQSWDWLQDGLLEPDRIQLGDGRVQSLALHGRNLRIIRVRDGERDETAQWWAPHEDDEDEADLSKGLWVPPGPEDDRRVFYATGAKGASHQFSRVEGTKLTWHATDKVPDGEINGGASAWNPTLLEITVAGCAAGDRAVDWAMWVQQQRFPDHYRDEGLKLPLALRLAAKTTEYALPHEYAEARLLEDVLEDGTAVTDVGTDGTEETGGTLALEDDEGEAEGDY
jgi:RNaseH domain of pPIWI_RE